MNLRLLADDLTGALDAGACFASRHGPQPVAWHSRPDAAWTGALDIETRDLAQDHALAELRRHLPRLAEADLAFKKVDSLMRGNSIAEIAECARSSDFGSIVIAPAFPAQHRVTRQGQQLAREGRAPWVPAGPNLLAAIGAGRTSHVRRGRPPSGRGAFVCDAETESDLACVAGSRQALEPPVLWCGTAGLARALAGEAARFRPPRFARMFAIVGSRQPVAKAQVGAVRARWPEAIVEADAGTSGEVVRRGILQALGTQGLALLVPNFPREEADSRLAALLTGFGDVIEPDLCFAAGGATLRILLDAIGCDRLEVEGEIEPGIPFSRLGGGQWAGAALVSKSGAFGDRSTIERLVDGLCREVSR